MDWYVLGIEPTKDKKAITNAYRSKLAHTNPEEKPEEFKALRSAYEEALRYAAQDESRQIRDESPVGLWMEQVQSLYQNFPARIDPASWESLLADPVCAGLDTRPAAEQALLEFLMEHYFLPQNVWKKLDERFLFLTRLNELYEICPRPFVDQVLINGIRFSDGLPYQLFTPGLNADACDTYRKLYFQANQTPPDQADEILSELEALPEQHPYGRALRLRQKLMTEERAQAIEEYHSLAAAYPEDDMFAIIWAELCLEQGNGEEAEAVSRSILDREPDSKSASRILAEALALQGRYDEAKEVVYDLLHAVGGNPVVAEQLMSLLTKWNEQLIGQREVVHQQHPEDTENAIELAWCYIQSQRMDEARKIALMIDQNCADSFAYHNLLAKLYHNLQDFQSSLPHLHEAVDVLRSLPADGTAETEKKRRRLPEFLQLLGNCLLQLGNRADAMVYFDEALSIAPDQPEVLTLMGRMLYLSGDYERAVSVLEDLVRVTPDSSHGSVLLALALFKMHRDRDAFDAINNAIATFPGDLSAYVIKMHILLRNGVFEEVHAVLDHLEANNAPKSTSVDFIRAMLTELEEKDPEQAMKQYRAIAKVMEKEGNEGLLFPSQLYFRMAMILGEEGKTPIDKLIAMMDQGLSEDEFDIDCLSYKAWLLNRSGRAEEAIALYRTLLERSSAVDSAEYGLAEVYSANLNCFAEEAMAFYRSLLEKRQTPELYFYAATCLRQMGDYAEARRYYLKELELNPEDVDGYNGLAYVCDAQGDYEQSLAYIDQALEAMESSEQVYPWLINHKIQILRRMGNPEAALAAAETAQKQYHSEDAYQQRFDICCQFGLWDAAKQVIAQWKQAKPGDPYAIKAEGRLHLLRGEMFKCALSMGKIKHKLPFEEIEDFRLQLQDLECSHNKMLQIRKRRVKDDQDNDYLLMNLAESLWRTGKRQEAVEIAQRALSILDDTLKQHLTDEAIFRSRRSLLLAMVGKEAEARQELTRTRNLPLCEFCEYGSCKDADVFEAQIEELLGNTERAKQLYTLGKSKWPDEPDFSAGLARLKKKGR